MLTVLSILCFLLILTVLVVVHEAGHALVARLCGARVTEFFVGMPWGPEAAWRSKRTGIKYGATFALLGGYTKIAGMATLDDPVAPLALALINARGSLTAEELARVAGCKVDDAVVTLAMLADWGSIEEAWQPGERRRRSDVPRRYRTTQRDARGLTVYDRGHDFSLPGSTCAGEPFLPDCTPDEFFAREKARTYSGMGFWKRMVILVAGVACNIALALALLVSYCMIAGVPTVTGVDPHIAEVASESQAEAVGIAVGDEIVRIAGVAVEGVQEAVEALDAAHGADGPVEIVLLHEGQELTVQVVLGDEEPLGVSYGYAVEEIPLGFFEALGYSVEYTGEVAKSVMSLLVPSKAGEVLEDSAGVVGIAVLTQDAVSQGFWPVVLLAAMLSMSLGWMNLLPIPPLDGGKGLIEVVQAIIRRPLSPQLQNAVSFVGIALFLLLFFYMVTQDVTSLFGA